MGTLTGYGGPTYHTVVGQSSICGPDALAKYIIYSSPVKAMQCWEKEHTALPYNKSKDKIFTSERNISLYAKQKNIVQMFLKMSYS